MANLQSWEEKIKAKRKNTEFREFVKEIASWSTLWLYKRNWVINKYPEESRLKHIASSDEVEAVRDGKISTFYDKEISFFENFWNFFRTIPHRGLVDFWWNENSEYADSIFWAKNSYLSFVVGIEAENVVYSAFSYANIKNVFNSIFITDNSENVYFSIGISQSMNVFYSKNISNSANIWFSTNLRWCQECLACDNLLNSSYCIGNIQYTKEEYLKLKTAILSWKDKYELYKEKMMENTVVNFVSPNSSGRYLVECQNTENGLWITQIHDSRNVVMSNGVLGCRNFFDWMDVGNNSHDFYATNGVGTNASNIYCTTQADSCSNIYYSYSLSNCSFCLGCIGLKNKSYCILNKQYTKEEWYELADKIFASMDVDGTLGDFFPGNLNPFYFNDTMAYLIDDTFTKEEVEREWYMWRDEAIKVDIPEGADIIETKDLGKYEGFDTNGNWAIQEEILKKVIRDEKGNFYKIVPMELEFLRKHKLPLPEIHWLERIKMGFRM